MTSPLRLSPGVDTVNVALETALKAKEEPDWTPVTVDVASATLTIRSTQVSSPDPARSPGRRHGNGVRFVDENVQQTFFFFFFNAA